MSFHFAGLSDLLIYTIFFAGGANFNSRFEDDDGDVSMGNDASSSGPNKR